MALDPENIRVYGDGEIYIAAYGTTLPTTLAGALAAGFLSLGYLTEDGFQLNTEIETYEIGAWQSRQRPPSSSQLITGKLSRARIGTPHFGQRERGSTVDCWCGNRCTTTLR